jgi:hypothetical protein
MTRGDLFSFAVPGAPGYHEKSEHDRAKSRARYLKSLDADLMLSIHANASRTHSAQRMEVFWEGSPAPGAKSAKLAEAMLAGMIARMNTPLHASAPGRTLGAAIGMGPAQIKASSVKDKAFNLLAPLDAVGKANILLEGYFYDYKIPATGKSVARTISSTSTEILKYGDDVYKISPIDRAYGEGIAAGLAMNFNCPAPPKRAVASKPKPKAKPKPKPKPKAKAKPKAKKTP